MRELNITGPHCPVTGFALTAVKLIYSRSERRRSLALLLDHVQTLLVPVAAVTWFVLAFAAIIWMQHEPIHVISPLPMRPSNGTRRNWLPITAGRLTLFISRTQRIYCTNGSGSQSEIMPHLKPYPPTAYYIQGALLKVPFVGYLLSRRFPLRPGGTSLLVLPGCPLVEETVGGNAGSIAVAFPCPNIISCDLGSTSPPPCCRLSCWRSFSGCD